MSIFTRSAEYPFISELLSKITYLTKQVHQLSDYTLNCHVGSQDTADLGEHSACLVHVIARSLTALCLDTNNDASLDCLLKRIHKFLVCRWKISQSIA